MDSLVVTWLSKLSLTCYIFEVSKNYQDNLSHVDSLSLSSNDTF